MRDLGMITNDEPATRLFTQGMVIKDGAKMSKSKGNVVSPDDMIARYGADATRMYALFAAPPDRDLDWQEEGVAGISRFLSRVYRLVTKYAASVRGVAPGSSPAVRETPADAGAAAQAAPDDSQDHAGLSRALALQHVHRRDHGAGERDDCGRSGDGHRRNSTGGLAEMFRTLVLLLAPFAPFLSAELWEEIGGEGSILRTPWPKCRCGVGEGK